MTRRIVLPFAVAVVLGVGSACAGTTGVRGRPGHVRGVVLSAPQCPGPERVGHPCQPRPVAGAAVEAMRGRHMVASTHTDDHGGFSLSLPAGRRYLIHATNIGGYRSTAQQMVDVGGGLIARITLTVDTGIR